MVSKITHTNWAIINELFIRISLCFRPSSTRGRGHAHYSAASEAPAPIPNRGTPPTLETDQTSHPSIQFTNRNSFSPLLVKSFNIFYNKAKDFVVQLNVMLLVSALISITFKINIKHIQKRCKNLIDFF